MHRRRYSPVVPLLPLPLLIILLPTIALILLLSLISLSSHIFRPISVKKGWDSLNVLLVSFAVLCGIFARRNEDEPIADEGNTMSYAIDQEAARNSVSSEWIDHRCYNTTPAICTGRLKRNSSSYPDLRQDSAGETGDNRFRFFDDFDLSKYRSQEADVLNFHRHRRQESEIQDESKDIPVDTFVLSSSTPTPSPSNSPAPPPLPPHPPPSARHHKPRRAYRSVGHKRKVEDSSDHCNAGFEEIKSPPPPPPPPRPPPPLSVPTVETERKYSKSGGKMSNATKEIKMALASLYSQTKRKKKKLKRKNLSDDYSDHAPEEPVHSTRPPPSLPPPPPPPPPPSVFHNLLRKTSKSKRIHSWSAPPPPPPPPPPRSSKPKKSQTPTPPPPPPKAPQTPRPESSRRRPESTTGRPPLPTRTDQFYDETASNGGHSRLIPMPPLPPPPPFEMPKTQLVIRGDFVRIRSTHNSRCSSPELDDLYVSSSKGNPDTVSTMDGGDGVMGSAFCPSPDVNVKADAFIARLRDEWRLEKMNSAKKNSILETGPDLGPGLGPSMRL